MGRPDDPYEQEADTIAEQIVNMQTSDLGETAGHGDNLSNKSSNCYKKGEQNLRIGRKSFDSSGTLERL